MIGLLQAAVVTKVRGAKLHLMEARCPDPSDQNRTLCLAEGAASSVE